jgi:hypothetical protein
MGSLQSPPMAPPSPARLYATLVGAFLFVLGLAGFFEDLSWLNFLHVATGALALLLAGAAPRPCALCLGLLYTGIAAFAFAEAGWLHLAVGLLGLAAAASTRGSLITHSVQKEPRNGGGRSEARAQAAGKGP